MQVLLCDTYRQPVEREGHELTLLRGALVSAPGEVSRLTVTGGGVISATLCSRCGERIAAILRPKLQDPCPACEVAPLRVGDTRAEARAEEARRLA